jgi:DNA processing protein
MRTIHRVYNRAQAHRAGADVTVPERQTAIAEEDAELAYWVAISRVPHIGPARIERLLKRFGSLRAAWQASYAELRAVLDPRPLTEIVALRARFEPDRELEKLTNLGIRATYPGHRAYPRLLAEISGRPSVLYTRGELTDRDEAAIGIVGTRRATAYGRQAAERVAGELAAAGVTVISGLARGVDAVAHRAALDAGGRTVAVLGSGPDVIYPPEHRRLAEQICEAGAIVSELPPGAKPDAQNFPARNRIISGMALGVVVIEAPARSGSLITAGFAADQGREVFVVPGSIFAASSEGTNALLRDGARVIRDGSDILEDLGLAAGQESATLQGEMPLDADELRLFAVVRSEPQHIDELAEEAGLAAATAAALFLTLELKGLVRNHGAQFYARR